jgi:hypothetical protein
LQTIEGYVIEIAGAIEIPLFVSHDLLKKVVSARFTLLSLEKQIVCGRNLVVLIILNVSYSLIQITVWTNT